MPEPRCGAASWRRPHLASWGAATAQVCVRGDVADGYKRERGSGPVGKGHTRTLNPAACVTPGPPTGKTANWHSQTQKARGAVQMAGTRSLPPGCITGTPARTRDLRSCPELGDHERRQQASGREEGRAPRAGAASGPRRARSPGVPITHPGPCALATGRGLSPHVWGDGRAVSDGNVFYRSLDVAKS